MKIIKIILLPFLIIVASCSRRVDPQNWTDAQVNQWFAQKEWLHGENLRPGSSINKREFAIYYYKHPKRWDTTFAFLASPNLDSISIGRHNLDGDNAYAMVSQYFGRNADSSHFEEHRLYADVHYVVSGAEYIERADTAGDSVVQPYNIQKDIMYVNANGYCKMLAMPSTFFIFFPDDAHMASLRANDSLVKKVVVKVKLN